MLTFPHECTYSPEERRLCQLFAERMERLGQTEAEAAADIGYTASSLSTLLGGVYGASPVTICKKIRQLLTAEAREAAAVQLPSIAETQVVRDIEGYCRGRRDRRTMGFVCGQPGIGRSVGVRRFAATNENVHLFSIPSGCTPVYILRVIAASLGVSHDKKTRLAIRDSLIKSLRGLPGGLLIFDEADHMNLEVADAVRDLWDESHCGQVWTGTRRFVDYLDNHYDSLAGQVRRRLGEILHLPALDGRDVAAILAQYADWPEELHDLAAERCQGNTGRLCSAIIAARTAASGGVPSRRNLEDAFRALGPLAAPAR